MKMQFKGNEMILLSDDNSIKQSFSEYLQEQENGD